MAYLERRNGRFYAVLKIPAAHRPTLKQRELRFSLYTYHRVQAQELAQACWLAFREILRNPTGFNFQSTDDLKAQIRSLAMAHAPDQYTSLIELTGTASPDKLTAAIKLLLAYNTEFFVLAPSGIKGTLYKKSNGHWDAISTLNGQTFPHLRIQSSLVQDTLTTELDVMEPETLTYTCHGEERLLKLETKTVYGFHQLFVPTELQPNVLTAVRKLCEVPQPVTVTEAAPPAAAASELLSTEINRYCKEKTTPSIAGDKRSTQWSQETHDEQRSKLKLFEEIVGDKPVLTLGRSDYKLFVDEIRKCPKARNTNPKTKGKSWKELMTMNLTNVISPSTVIQYHGTVTAFVSWLDREYENKGMNTSIQHALKASGIHKQVANREDTREPFTDEHISLMFESDKAIEFLSKAKIKPGENAWKLFLPILGATSGARLNELCSFSLSDIGEENGIPYLDMNLDDDELKSLKNRNAKRRIPIHPVVLDCHFMEYVEYMRSLHERKTEGRLFPDLTFIKGHGYRKYATDWFNTKFLTHLGIKSSALNFHSYRRYVLGKLQRSSTAANTWRIDRLVGHEHGRKEPESIRTYLDKSLSDTLPVLDDLTFTVDWSRYKTLCASTYK